MTEVVRIIAAVVDTQRLTMYKEDGSTIVIPQGDSRIRPLVDKVIPQLEKEGFCNLEVKDLDTNNHYSAAEEGMGGFVQFFRMFKNTMEDMISKFSSLDPASNTVAPTTVGSIPTGEQTQTQSAVSEIMANATPTSSPDFGSTKLTEDETIVAVLENGSIIPGIEKIDIQLQALASKMGSNEGVKKFFERVSSVNRAHSVQDLLTFMQKGELPIADDGSVLVYKRLRSSSEAGVFVDCHSGKVKQRVGSHVFMDEKLVDPNRHQDCSNGLHVARRDYLNSFSGDITVLAKLAPEDVIAVPHSDARKLRARGYHIIAQLSIKDARLVNSNHPMNDTVLLGNAVKGNHIGIIETVEITQQMGGGLVITKVKEAEEIVLQDDVKAESLDKIPEVSKENSTVDAASVAKQVSSGRKSARQEKADQLLKGVLEGKTSKIQIQKAKELLAFKKDAKVSWDKLGISAGEVERITLIANGAAPVAEVKPVKSSSITKPKPTAPSRVVNDVELGLGTPKQRIRKLLDNGLTSVGVAQAIVKLKKDAKKGWDKLGVSDAEVTKILKLAGK